MSNLENNLWYRGMRAAQAVDFTSLATLAIGTVAIAIALGSI